MRNKKGNVFDIIFYIFVMFVIAITILIAAFIMSSFNTKIQASPELSADSKTVFSDQATRFPILFDNVIIFIMTGLAMVTVISAFFIRSHPIFFFFSFLALGITIAFGAIFSNVYYGFMTDPQLATTAVGFTKMNYLMTRLPLVATIMGGIVLLVLYGKFNSGGGSV